MKRDGEPDRNLFHHGGRVFNPAGAEAVRIHFEPKAGRATTLSVVDGPLRVKATR
jgi:L-asparaginase II